ncbi:ABC transporter permease [Dissulfurirhabdus thermomarina]|uniref:ABC transporter permease n=1 Tax=Dissulfurirhabdus thermomarina TaxID=1765737 RepID=A0A6N9TL56_DISTH|nr:ABC transporter permease [Dissulfurirhabdus thermomarina]NDY41849.1 ABC transporter permease [Dissulfurirhabdus thermomarina]NMX22997.1 ABC transporter permease [Dissulfurirhabdus thermomarina]
MSLVGEEKIFVTPDEGAGLGRPRRFAAALLSFGVFAAVWQLGVAAFHVSPLTLPGPADVAAGLWELLWSGRLLDHVVASLFRVTWGYLLAVVLAVPLGLVLGVWSLGWRLFNPVIQFFRPISPLAWIPLALTWFGIGDRPAIFLIFLSSFFPLLVFTMSGVACVKTTYIRVALNFGIRGVELLRRVILPGARPSIVVGLRITLGTAWLVIVAAEMIAVKSGLGYLIVDARNAFRMDQVVGGMVVIGAIGLGLDLVIRRLELLPSIRWHQMER